MNDIKFEEKLQSLDKIAKLRRICGGWLNLRELGRSQHRNPLEGLLYISVYYTVLTVCSSNSRMFCACDMF